MDYNCPTHKIRLKPRVVGVGISKHFYNCNEALWESEKDLQHELAFQSTENKNKTIMVCPLCTYAIDYSLIFRK